jgi:hypothetical protein
VLQQVCQYGGSGRAGAGAGNEAGGVAAASKDVDTFCFSCNSSATGLAGTGIAAETAGADTGECHFLTP